MTHRNIWVTCGVIFEGFGVQMTPMCPAGKDYSLVLFQGLAYLLDNHLSHPLMKTLLPTLGNFLHDDSEKVRVTFIDLLLKVKGIRAIKVGVSGKQMTYCYMTF